MDDENLYKHHVASLRRGVKKNKSHATARRRNDEKIQLLMKAYKKLYVAAWRRGVKHLNLSQRRDGATMKKYDD